MTEQAAPRALPNVQPAPLHQFAPTVQMGSTFLLVFVLVAQLIVLSAPLLRLAQIVQMATISLVFSAVYALLIAQHALQPQTAKPAPTAFLLLAHLVCHAQAIVRFAPP